MKLHHKVLGSGPDLVLLHGWGMHSGIMDSIARHYQSRFCVHSIDLPGHGYSRNGDNSFTLDQVSDALTAIIPDHALLVGWSLGSLISLNLALREPQRTAKLVMLCGSPQFFNNKDWGHGMSQALLRGFADNLGKDFRQTVLHFLGLCAHGSPAMRDDLRQLKARVFEPGEPAPEALASGLAILQQASLVNRLAEIKLPVHFIMGQHDRIVPPDAAHAAAALLPDARVSVITGASHLPFVSHASACFNALDQSLL